MGNQCLKKIADSDKDGYKQHNQMYVKQDDNAFFILDDDTSTA